MDQNLRSQQVVGTKPVSLHRVIRIRLILQRDFVLLRDFGYYNETLPLRWFKVRRCNCERVRLL